VTAAIKQRVPGAMEAAESTIADEGLAGLASAGTAYSVTAAIMQRVPGAMEAAKSAIAAGGFKQLACVGTGASVVEVICQLRSANAGNLTELVGLFISNWKYIGDLLLPSSLKRKRADFPMTLLSSVCSALRILPPASQRKVRVEWSWTSPEPHVTAAIEAARLSVLDLGKLLASLAPGAFITPEHVLSCSCTAVLVVNSTNNFSLRTNKRANWVHSPSDDEHHRYAKQLLDYAKRTFRSAIFPQGLNQYILALALGVNNCMFSQYLNLNAKLSKSGVGIVERALDGPRGIGGSFQIQLEHMEASGILSTAMGKYSEHMQEKTRKRRKRGRKAK
jgi:hypothetical protein